MYARKDYSIYGSWKKKLLNDFPLTWMFYSQSNDSKITRLHERCLGLIYSDKSSSYEKLSERDGSVSIHQKNIQAIQLKSWSKTLKDIPYISDIPSVK